MKKGFIHKINNSNNKRIRSEIKKNMNSIESSIYNFNNVKRLEISKRTNQKIIIGPLKEVPKLTLNYDNVWKRLQNSINSIFNSKPISDSLEELYKICENLCKYKFSSKLYENIKEECKSHLKSESENLLLQINNEEFLKIISNSWSLFCKQLIMIRSIFLYLDRTYALQTANIEPLWNMGIDLYKTYIIDSLSIKEKTIGDIIELIQQDRNKAFKVGEEKRNYDLLKLLIKMLLDLGVYNEFERKFLESSTIFYKEKGKLHINEILIHFKCGQLVAQYLKYVDTNLNEEVERCTISSYKGYIDSGTRKNIVSIVEGELIVNYLNTLLEKGFDDLMDSKAFGDLTKLYNLVNRVDLLDCVKNYFGNYIKKTGSMYVMDPSRDPVMVQSLLDFKKYLDDVLSISFSQNEKFSNTIKECFEIFINQRQNKPAELIAKFIDSKLRQTKGITEKEIEVIQDKCMLLFRFIQGKDIFEAYYKKDLAKRLLLNKSISIELEKRMITKLKNECGSGFTSKLEGMFKDIDISRDIVNSFNQNPEYCSKIGSISLNVNVLTSGFWPTYNQMKFNMPDELFKCQEIFKEFYVLKHSGRRLQWQNSLGHCTLKAFFPSDQKDLIVSLAQTVILLLFNNSEKLTYKEIIKATEMDEKELKRTLQSLTCGKARVILKSEQTKTIDENEVFTFNTTFESKLRHIKINAIQSRESIEEQHSTFEKVFHDRQFQIDAAIVRIMKTRKSLNHSLLLSELFKQLKFSIKPQDLKKRIESLIEREYIRRDPGNATIYNYVA